MANKTIHELNSVATLNSSDELAIYDVSESTTGNGTIGGILGTNITGLDTTATNLIGAINQHENDIESLNQSDLLYADDDQTPSGEVEFISQDTELIPSSTVSVDLLSGNDSWSQRFVKISQMFKNIRYLTSIPVSRIRGKQVAIYGDSWAASYHGSLGADYISECTGKTVHVVADPGGTMQRVYNTTWDNYNADIYVIIGGLNDLGANTTLTNFQQAIYQFVNSIRTVNSSAEIYFITPPMMTTATVHNSLYPLEMYRTVIWRRAATQKYNVINSLKWTDVTFESDNTHPIIADASKIGKHIVTAICNYGDEETHINDYSTIYNLSPDHIKFRCDGGHLSLEFTALSVTVASNSQYILTFPITGIGQDLLPVNFAVMSSTMDPIFVYRSTTADSIVLAKKGAATGSQLYISGANIPIKIRTTIFE